MATTLTPATVAVNASRAPDVDIAYQSAMVVETK
jgi:hypothetical protein